MQLLFRNVATLAESFKCTPNPEGHQVFSMLLAVVYIVVYIFSSIKMTFIVERLRDWHCS